MTRAEAIRKIEYGLGMETSEPTSFGQITAVRTDALKVALTALKEQEEYDGLKNSYDQLQASFDQIYESNMKMGEELRKKPMWISVKERLPSKEESDRSIVGIVNGNNGKIGFVDALIFVSYDHEENVWFSWDYDIEGCEVKFWMSLPEPPEEE